MAVINLRVGFDQRTVARLAAALTERAMVISRDGADEAGKLMVQECGIIINQERKTPSRSRPGIRPLEKMYTYKVVRQPAGHRAFITNSRTLNSAERGKFFMNELGRAQPYQIPKPGEDNGEVFPILGPGGQRQYAERIHMPARPGRHIARRARDRVYQRIRRGSV